MAWREALNKLMPLLCQHEVVDIEANLESSSSTVQSRTEEALANAGEHPLVRARVFVPFIRKLPDMRDSSDCNSYNQETLEFYSDLTRRWQAMGGCPVVDFSSINEWLPKEDNPYSLGQYGSTTVNRTPSTRCSDITLDRFQNFWASKKGVVLGALPKECLTQVVTDESDKSNKGVESYRRQRILFVELAKAIAAAEGVLVNITWGSKGAEDPIFDSRRPDSFFKIGDSWIFIELKTTKGDNRKIAEARGQVVILGNVLWRLRSRYQLFYTFQNEVLGLVGNGIDVQCVRQIHAYGRRVKTYDGWLLPLANEDLEPGDSYVVDIESPSLEWVAAALYRVVMTNASNMSARGEMNKDGFQRKYGSLKLMTQAGYWVGSEYLQLASETRVTPPSKEVVVTVVGATRNNKISVVMKVLWEGEVWWLKVGPEAEARSKALEEPDELPTGGWERWFQTERDMISRAMLGDGVALAVALEGVNRPAMLVKDAGDSVEKQQLSRQFAPADVYEMSKQLYEALEASGTKGVIHGDVCLENICLKGGVYSLIDWGLACGHPFSTLAPAVDKAWPGLDVVYGMPKIPNWEMSPDCYFCGGRPSDVVHDEESLLYCCLKMLGGNTLPWSDAAVSGDEFEVLQIRTATMGSLIEEHGRHLYPPLLRKACGVNRLAWSFVGSSSLLPTHEAERKGDSIIQDGEASV
ncbi:hypothetical protein SELMODRAFT_411800 [Selaginella moellendorffii]|uniref:Protein kinase domain-containing protein n=1 Tax=Selaginella moellendorffii TaxID=88036 RepID=D8RJ29_SELML|nr:hypothetical protein SELMODRAFT_411800 [Selaginella moellendorffii]